MGQFMKTYPDLKEPLGEDGCGYNIPRFHIAYAVNKRVPLVTEDSKPQRHQGTPKKTSSVCKNVSNLNLCLMVLKTLVPLAQPTAIEQLEPDINLRLFAGKSTKRPLICS